MANSTNEEKLKLEASKIDLKTRRIMLWTAIVVLVGTLIPTITVVFTYKEVKGLLVQLIEKPLEGEWAYSSDYEKYYDEPEPHDLHAGGKAMVVWKHRENRYDVNLNYSIRRSDSQNPILTIVLRGSLKADEHGWPAQENFVMDNFEVINRQHYKNIAHTMPYYQFRDCSFIRNGDLADKIRCILQTKDSMSKVTFTWRAPLH